MKIDLPLCGKCNKLVDRIEMRMQPLSRDIIAEVFCHGQREQTTLQADLAYGGPVKVEVGVAFRTNAREALEG